MSTLQGRFQLQQGEFTLDIDFQTPSQGITALFGPSGSGKTTLLRCLAGLERAKPGFLEINGNCWQDVINVPWVTSFKKPVYFPT